MLLKQLFYPQVMLDEEFFDFEDLNIDDLNEFEDLNADEIVYPNFKPRKKKINYAG